MTSLQSFFVDDMNVAHKVTVECEITDGIGIHLVGLSDNAAKETLLRVVTAMNSRGFRVPGKKVVINILPSDWGNKLGAGLDIPIALAIVSASGQMSLQKLIGNVAYFGELRLDSTPVFPNQLTRKEVLRLARSLGFDSIVTGWNSDVTFLDVQDSDEPQADSPWEMLTCGAGMRRVFEIGERVWYEDDHENGWATIALINRQSAICQQPCSDYDNDILTLVKMNGFSEIETTPSRIYQLAPGTFRGKDVCWEHVEGSDYPLWCPDEQENCFFFELDKQ